ncbi:TBC1 domain family member 20 isoform X2 [Ctenocephalides felis]|uniref:TBC1 domain family member 20 isoform X2 n=1 Tax=Ctenocephalides felis TaxID=7515 RepID=UPI000E6E4599|nr:TBC1 domain family member 20 isoform X2 [Ctenocephalides felis]
MDTENEESNESWLVVPNKIDENVKSDEGSNGIQKKDAIINAAEASELSFEKIPESDEERIKRIQIERALEDSSSNLETWRKFAISTHGLISDDLRRRVWPLLLGVVPALAAPVPTLEELQSHPEYTQVVLDVNRSLKRFPPGIPYEQRVALQDQLTVLILRVITKYPHLKYYQGYHDVAVTCLLVVGDRVAFHMMEVLSTGHLEECMGPTMEPTQRRLMYIYPIINKEHPQLCEFLERSTVGTMFALPWYLTWFGHSLPYYRTVVRLFDYFLASTPLFPLYVAAAIVLHRVDEIFEQDCDMASLHCLLSNLPDDLPFEKLLISAAKLYEKYPPEELEKDVQIMMDKERDQRLKEQQARLNRLKYTDPRHKGTVNRWWGSFRGPMKYLLVSASILMGIYAYYRSQDTINRRRTMDKAHILEISANYNVF